MLHASSISSLSLVFGCMFLNIEMPAISAVEVRDNPEMLTRHY